MGGVAAKVLVVWMVLTTAQGDCVESTTTLNDIDRLVGSHDCSIITGPEPDDVDAGFRGDEVVGRASAQSIVAP